MAASEVSVHRETTPTLPVRSCPPTLVWNRAFRLPLPSNKGVGEKETAARSFHRSLGPNHLRRRPWLRSRRYQARRRLQVRLRPVTEASVPVQTDDDSDAAVDDAASGGFGAVGRVFSTPVVSQPQRGDRPTHAASTTAVLRSMAAFGDKDAPSSLVLGLTAPSRTSAAVQAYMVTAAITPDLAESASVVAAVVMSASARRQVANTHMGPIPPIRVAAVPPPRPVATPRARTVVTAIPDPIQGPQPRVRASCKTPNLANPLVEPAFTATGAQYAWCEIFNARIPQPIDLVTECSVTGIEAFADW
ncbi:unnamed protein product [Phytophthora fragariaefolia]|uniref:Unnamed protein product n=1 Tax=Phytophthora fragariaefolia TaxID=1490495 RepID=A0A9W7CLP0_9STRA|nr:unnamed protein product [Phytophthora fragariaefolia]